ncbi:unnamed protein product [Danaus chrysippus]|uniref:(African queen) hypothetical protein n=1 Tax=Danaus chrysippus TaxID=151541 RepID=A0A8J2WB50_9NEOP|nr:unnamed protein product [Danaus chrysippus]
MYSAILIFFNPDDNFGVTREALKNTLKIELGVLQLAGMRDTCVQAKCENSTAGAPMCLRCAGAGRWRGLIRETGCIH